MLRIFVLDPVVAAALAIRAVGLLRNETFQPHQAGMPKEVGANLALLEGCGLNALAAAAQQSRQVGLAQRQRQAAIVVTIPGQHVKGVELDLMIVLAGMQGAEVRVTIDAEHGCLAIEDEPLASDLLSDLDDPRLAVCPIVAALGEQAHALALPHQLHAVAVMLDLVKPVGTGRDLMG